VDWFDFAAGGVSYGADQPIGVEPFYRGPDDHWLYSLTSADLYSEREPGAPVRSWKLPASSSPSWREPKGPMMENTWGYDDPLIRIAMGKAGDPPAPGSEFYGGLDPDYRVVSLGELTQSHLFSALRLPQLGPLSFPTTPRATQQQPAQAAFPAWLLYGAIALALYFVARR